MLAYVVQPGNTLSGIADAFGSSVETITAANGIPNPDLIFPGMILGVPSSPDHTGAPHGRKEKMAQDEKLVVELVALLEEKSRAWRAPREWRRVGGSWVSTQRKLVAAGPESRMLSL